LTHKVWEGESIQEPPKDIIAVSFDSDAVVDHEKFANTIKQMGEKLLRLKGNIKFDGNVEFVETVSDITTYTDANPNLLQKTAFTVITWKLEKEQVTKLIESCYL